MPETAPPDNGANDEEFLAEARALVGDLFAPRAEIYWLDFLLSVSLGWTAFTATVLLPAWSVVQAGTYLVCTFALFRAAIFIHELAHLGSRAMPGFRLVWNLVCGCPLLVPSFSYAGVHNFHHYPNVYGTAADGEYLPFARMRPAAIVGYVALATLLPLLLLLRSLVLTPLSWFIPPLADWVWERASSLTIDFNFRRPHSRHDDPYWRQQELGAWLYATGGITLMILGVLPWQVLVVWYLVLAGIFTVNSLRTLAAHRYRFPGERSLTVMEQFQDSVDVPGHALLTALWAPVGLRYHATHHLFPAMPYHNLAMAYRRLAEGLSDRAWFLKATEPSLWRALRRLLQEAAYNSRTATA
ncbi:MAG: fatty acid desaturase [Gammaproteobacteria bacterium]|nr:fatty acid desaturase [Gammaproteobacteria bacterium]